MPGIGLAGTHRVGKTTLAKEWCENEGVDYVTPDVRGTIAKIGLECADVNDTDTRIEVQRAVVQSCREAFLDRKTMFVTDRTPMDVAAYTMADCHQQMTPAQSSAMMDLIDDCYHIHNSSMAVAMLIYPGIPWVDEPGKPPFNVAYQEHIHALILGLMKDLRNDVHWFQIGRKETDPERRMIAMDELRRVVLHPAITQAEHCVIN